MSRITFIALIACLIAIGLFFWSRQLLAPRTGPETSAITVMTVLPSHAPAVQGPSYLPPEQKTK